MGANKLQDRTRSLVQQRPRDVTLAHIAQATQTSVSWLKQFSRGKIDNPGVRKVEAVYTFLASKPLEF
jgi:hypothetical protein